MGLKGDPSKLLTFKAQLKALPTTLAAEVASKAAPAMTGLTHSAFTSGQTVYGDARPAGIEGEPLTLHRTGATEAGLRFVAIGTIVRCVLGPKYSKYLIGKYKVLPMGALPATWRARLNDLVHEAKPL